MAGTSTVELSSDARLGPVSMTEPQLAAWGEALGRALVRGEVGTPLVLALSGPLGAGKSALARAVARGAGVTGSLPSPTFNLLFSYTGEADLGVHHLDLYRLEDPEEVWELGWEELGRGREVVLIEWPERAGSLLPEVRWNVELRLPGAGAGAGNDNNNSGNGDPIHEYRWVMATRVGAAPDLPDPGDFGGSA